MNEAVRIVFSIVATAAVAFLTYFAILWILKVQHG
jgi:hypothetical protein